MQAAPEPGARRANIATVRTALEEHPEVELAVFPELFLDGYDPANAHRTASTAEEAVAEIALVAAAQRTAVVVGFAERRGEAIANSVALVSAAGELVDVYRKTHLFGAVEHETFAAGDEYLVAPLAGHQVGTLNCFDVEFPEPARALAGAGAQLLVTVAANMAPYADQHRLAARSRALENRLPHVYVNRVGHESGHTFVGGSCIVDQDGRVLAETDPGDGDQAGARVLLVADVPVGARPHDDFDYLDHLRDRLPVRTAHHPTAQGSA